MRENSLQNENFLKEETAKGSEKAFREIFDHYHDKLFQYILFLVKSTEIAEELVMDVFLKLWLGRNTLPQIENLDGFLFKVAYHKTIDFFRYAARNRKIVELLADQMEKGVSANIQESIISKEYEAELRNAINLLPPRRKQIYELSREENLSHEEISQKLSISKSTVANTIAEANQFIKDHIQKRMDLIIIATLYYIMG